ncbi:hypothetical protein D3C76_910080 [compost metagenome]
MIAGIETLQVQLLQGPCPPQAQGVNAGSAPAHYRRVIGDRPYGLGRPPDLLGVAIITVHSLDAAAETDRVYDLRAFELPGVTEIQPVLGLLLLPAIDHRLAKQAMFITDAITVGGNTQGRHAFHEASRQPPQATVAQRRVRL